MKNKYLKITHISERKTRVVFGSVRDYVDSTLLGAEVIEISGIPTERYLTDSISPLPQNKASECKVYSLHSDFTNKNFKAKLQLRDDIY
jgi:hypothetical protein